MKDIYSHKTPLDYNIIFQELWFGVVLNLKVFASFLVDKREQR